jgi:hypothetical protein
VASAIPLRASEARKEIARLYYISLARTHVLSAQIILAGIVGLGIAQDYGSLPLQPGRIPTVSAVLIMIGLLLLGILGRIAVDVTAEPLLETIAELRAEPSEVGLLRRAVELLDLACSGGAVDRRMQAPPPQLSEQVVASIERGHQAMLDAVAGLSATTRTLEATARSVADSLEATVRMAASQQQPANDEKLVAATTAFLQLQPAIEELTAVLRGLGPMTGQREATTPAAEPAPDTRVTPRVATELRRLLQEIDAG